MSDRVDVSDLHVAGADLSAILDDAELVNPGDAALNAQAAEEEDEDELPPVEAQRPNLTDKGNATLLVQHYGRDFRWCGAMRGGAGIEARGWMRWTGSRWVDDETKAIVRTSLLVADLWREQAPPEAEAGDLKLSPEAAKDNARRKALLKHAAKCEGIGSVRAMIALASAHTDVVSVQSDYDANPWLFNTPDRTYDLERGHERAYAPRREDLITRLAGSGAAERGTDCPTWRGFLERIMPDVEMRDFLQRAAGYCMTGSIREQCVFIAYGKGANGKSTFMRVLQDILGDYFAATRPETFIDRAAGGIPNDLAALASARLVVVSEPEEGAPLSEGLVKSATGGDPIPARFLNCEFFLYIPKFKLWILTNHKPVIKGSDHGIWRRIRLIPFTVTIPDQEQDKALDEKLRREYPAILRWMLEGLKEYNRVGLKPPAAVTDATAQYKSDMDVLADFLEDRCRAAPDVRAVDRARNGELYASYYEWARDMGFRSPLNQKGFSRALIDRGFAQDGDRSQGRRWLGLELKVRARTALFAEGRG